MRRVFSDTDAKCQKNLQSVTDTKQHLLALAGYTSHQHYGQLRDAAMRQYLPLPTLTPIM